VSRRNGTADFDGSVVSLWY